MCGIAGLWSFAGAAESDLRATAAAMASSLSHRGPDDAAVWSSPHGVAFGFQRLAIIDLSSAGAQPMASSTGRYVLAFNGEIYNFELLRKRLEDESTAPPWRGHSDTEVLLACIEAWGIDATLDRANGMFAFALWDSVEKRLQLARDRAGEKPLYYASTSRSFVFGSELKALERHGELDRRIDRTAAALYAAFGYVPAPHAIYAGVKKLAPGSLLTVRSDGSITEQPYWDPASVAVAAASHRFRGSEDEALEELDSLLGDAVQMRSISDVPLGVFLSGGVDSSLVTALLQKGSARPVSTFTIGFEDRRFDEAPHAAEVARILGTDHHELYITADDALRLVPSVVNAYDEPFGDSSAIPTFLVSHTARAAVTVALGGDGGDELFAGYHHHFLGRRLQRRVSSVPSPLRPAAARILRAMARSERDRRLARALAVSDPIVSYYDGAVLPGLGAEPLPALPRPPAGLKDGTEGVMFLDFTSYLPDDILVKVDRASMAVSLELRAPFLDPRVIQFAWHLPIGMKIREDRGKWLLKRLLRKYVPNSLVDREKQGFGVPLAEWLRGPLRDWAEPLLDARTVGESDVFDLDAVKLSRRRFEAGDDGQVAAIWRVLMFESWRRRTGATT